MQGEAHIGAIQPVDHSVGTWRADYESLLARLPAIVENGRLTLCGMSVCVDACAELKNLTKLLTSDLQEVESFKATLLERALQGVGGEVLFQWKAGPEWLNTNEVFQHALGGTGPQAAWVLTAAGAPALLALCDRSEHMMAQLPPDVLIADEGIVRRASEIAPKGTQRPDNYIIEFKKGDPIGHIVPPRSSRIIARFHDFGIEHDRDFELVSQHLAATAGTALISGFNCVPGDQLQREADYVFGLCREWTAAGLATIHLELAGYDAPEYRDFILDRCKGHVTSLGMSLSEFTAVGGSMQDLPTRMKEMAEQYSVRRLCVHADEWAATITLDDAEVEREALMVGCLLASCRAEAGRPVSPSCVPQHAVFDEPPTFSAHQLGAWKFVCCASPYIAIPASTLGLGDTFTAGCLLVLGQDRFAVPAHTRPSPKSGADNTNIEQNRRIQ
jgi:hypothetical protein